MLFRGSFSLIGITCIPILLLGIKYRKDGNICWQTHANVIPVLFIQNFLCFLSYATERYPAFLWILVAYCNWAMQPISRAIRVSTGWIAVFFLSVSWSRQGIVKNCSFKCARQCNRWFTSIQSWGQKKLTSFKCRNAVNTVRIVAEILGPR